MNVDLPLHLLLVDDREDSLLALEGVLAAPEYRLITASSGQQALEQLNRYPNFAAIILDVQMPGMDGFETAAAIKKNDRLKSIPIIFVTAISIDQIYIQKGYEVGAVDYLFKPFDPQILRSKVAVFAELFRQRILIKKQSLEIGIQEKRNRELLLAEVELENLRRYRNLADAVPLIVWKMLPNGKAEYFNQGWIDYTGLNLTQSAEYGWHSAFEPSSIEELRKLSNSLPENISCTFLEMECLINSKEGLKRWHLMRVVPETGPKGELIGWIGTCTDIHDQKTQAEILVRSNSELEKFAYIASHDLQEPLRTVSSFGSLLQSEFSEQLPADAKEYVSFMVQGSKRMQHLIDDLLLYSRVGTQGKEFKFIELNEIVDVAIGNLQAAIEKSSAEILIEPLPSMAVDAEQVIQVFQNLIGNAIKFQGNRPPKIRVSTRKFEEGWEFCIEDNGIGIEPKYLNRIFEIFQRLHTREEYPGSGIGLSICKKVIERHGGRIWAESNIGVGSKFFFTISRRLLRKEESQLQKAS